MNFLKSKPSLGFILNRSPEAKFIILGAFYTFFAIPALAQIRMFDLFTFFGIYIVIKHIISMPALSKKRRFISFVIIFILILECCLLFVYVFFTFFEILFQNDSSMNHGLTTVFSLILFLIYWITIRIKSNPNKISEIFKNILCEYFQLFAVMIFYILATRLILQRYDLPYIITLMIINIIIIASTNILSKKTSTILENLGFGYLFLALTFFSIPIKKEFISLENKVAIFLVILNFIGIAIVFLKNKNYAEKTKIILLAILMISLFFSNGPIIYCIYLISNFMIIRLIIVNEKLSILNASIFFILLIIAILIISMPLTAGRGGGVGYELAETAFLQLIILPIIIFFSNRTLKKRKLKNDIQNLRIN